MKTLLTINQTENNGVIGVSRYDLTPELMGFCIVCVCGLYGEIAQKLGASKEDFIKGFQEVSKTVAEQVAKKLYKETNDEK